MKQTFILASLLLCLASSHAQDAAKCAFSFGQNDPGDISIERLLSDSVVFDCSPFTNQFRLTGFSLTTKCDGVTRYFTNEHDGALTDAMKAEVRKMHAGCTVEFSKVWLQPLPGSRMNSYFYSGESIKFRIR